MLTESPLGPWLASPGQGLGVPYPRPVEPPSGAVCLLARAAPWAHPTASFGCSGPDSAGSGHEHLSLWGVRSAGVRAFVDEGMAWGDSPIWLQGAPGSRGGAAPGGSRPVTHNAPESPMETLAWESPNPILLGPPHGRHSVNCPWPRTTHHSLSPEKSHPSTLHQLLPDASNLFS